MTVIAVVGGLVIYLWPLWMIAKQNGGFFSVPVVAIIYTAGLVAGAVYWIPLAYGSIAMIWLYALMPKLQALLNTAPD